MFRAYPVSGSYARCILFGSGMKVMFINLRAFCTLSSHMYGIGQTDTTEAIDRGQCIQYFHSVFEKVPYYYLIQPYQKQLDLLREPFD
jgi:hypothetical protein